ncbi:MAG TPA: hypothetical protein VKH36_11750 [Acidimicrobiia bacterium]|nr:hypothetical protein [Acidimicrobiia bacterium]
MEDRDTAGLYLEMSDVDADEYARTRVGDVLGGGGVERATWWENACRDRTDLPRKLPEFSLLGVYEVTNGFTAPTTSDGVTGHHFRRTPRPGQGRLTGQPTVGLMLVLISPRHPGQAQALRDWADFVHIRYIAEVGVPGYSMITPYENVTGGDPRFLHFYEMDTDDPEAAFRTMTPLVADRIGQPGTEAWDAWANTPELRIMYVNTFRRFGERSA